MIDLFIYFFLNQNIRGVFDKATNKQNLKEICAIKLEIIVTLTTDTGWNNNIIICSFFMVLFNWCNF